MPSMIRTLFVLSLLALFVGCSDGSPRLVLVTVLEPGANPQDVADELESPVAWELSKIAGVGSVTMISSPGMLEAYINVRADANADEVVAGAEAALAHVGSQVPAVQANSVELLPRSATVPAIPPEEIPCIVLKLDRDRMAALGVTADDANQALVEPNRQADFKDRTKMLQELRVPTSGGETVPLTDFADIMIESQPSRIVNHWVAAN